MVGFKGTADENLRIPSNITVYNVECPVVGINDSAFKDCTLLKSITIPESVISIGDNAFSGCVALTTLNIDNTSNSISGSNWGAPSTTIIGWLRTPKNCTLTRDFDLKDLGFKGIQEEEFIIPETFTDSKSGQIYTITSIGDNMFNNFIYLKSVTLPNTVTSIGVQAFMSCSGLQKVTMSDTIYKISDAAFYNCRKLNTVHVSTRLDAIGQQVFGACIALTSIDIPYSVKSVHQDAFNGCTALTTISVDNATNAISGAPWGATNATVRWIR